MEGNTALQLFVLNRITIFQDYKEYAWELLQSQMNIQVHPSIDGKDIAKLLSLYMRGVEKLNSMQDKREIFFRNKMTSLMMKPNVVKSLSKQNNTKAPEQSLEKKKTQIIKERVAQVEKPAINQDLITKKKQMQMRLTYSTQQHTSEALSKMITQHHQKASTLTTKIEEIVQENNKKLQQRIRLRKLKTMTARSKSELNHDESKEVRNNKMMEIQVIKQENEETKKKKKNLERKYSHDIKSQKFIDEQPESAKKRKKTFDFVALQKLDKNFKL